MEKNIRNGKMCEWAVLACFLLAAVWFFCPIGQPEGKSVLFAMRLALPAIVLALGSLWLRPKWIMMAFWFCALGDAMGVLGSFEGQMGGFALAHICYVSFFLKCIRQGRMQSKALTVTTLLSLIPLIVAAFKVIPAVPLLPIRVGCVIYALLLIGTMWTSMMRAFAAPVGERMLPSVAALGGILFLVSDFVLSWNKFTSHIPQASILIMSTYYAALLFLFVGTAKKL